MALLHELAQTYLTACDVEGKARSTIRGYRESLTRLQEVGARLEFPAEVEAFTVQHVYAFLGALRERGASRAYQHRLHREVKAFFSWCKRFDVITENVFARVPLVKLEQQIVQPFSTDDVRRLLAAIHRGVRAGTRNYALVLFLLDTGVRASECVSVRLDDVWACPGLTDTQDRACSPGRRSEWNRQDDVHGVRSRTSTRRKSSSSVARAGRPWGRWLATSV